MNFYYIHTTSPFWKAEPVYDGCTDITWAWAYILKEIPEETWYHCRNAPDVHPYLVKEPARSVACAYEPGTKGDIVTSIDFLLIRESILSRLAPSFRQGMTTGEVITKPGKVLNDPYVYVYSSIELPLNVLRSDAKVAYKCPYCPYVRYQHKLGAARFVDENQWNGEDFFRVAGGWAYFLVTEPLAEALAALKPKGICITEQSKLIRTN
jgi:hypothetical protein